MIYLFFTSVFFLAYIYMLYPLFLFLISRFMSSGKINSSKPKTLVSPKITVLVPAHNEEKVISEKIENHLKLSYPNYSILVVSDSSTDSTSNIVKMYCEKYPSKISLFEVEDCLGKTNAINKAIEFVDSEIVVFTDANVYLKADALLRVSEEFTNPKVGGVAGSLIYINADNGGAAGSNGIYWKYEEMIKKFESETGSIMGADGSIFAIKKELFRKLPIHVLDDFCTSMGVLFQGYKFKFNDAILAYEKGADNTKEEFFRKVRISNRSYNSFLFMRKDVLNKLSFFDAWKFYSHKVLRWYSFIFMIFAYFSNLYICFNSFNFSYFFIIFWGQTIFYIFSFISFKNKLPKIKTLNKVSSIAEYFTMANIATIIGLFQSLKGKKTITWKKADSTR